MAANTPLMSTKTHEIIARDLGLMPSDYGIYIVKSGLVTLVPGMIVTTFGESGSDIDIFTDGDEYATGIVIKRTTRRISAGGDIDDDIDTAFAAGDEIEVLHWTGGRAIVYMWLTGSPVSAARGTMRRGAAVWLMDSTNALFTSTNPTIGAAFAAVLGSIDMNASIHALVQIGILLMDATILDSTSSVAGILAKVLI